MRWIVRSSLRLRFLVVAIGAALVVVGVGQARRTPVDVFPEFAPPTVEVQTECVGLSPAEVEQVVTTPLEQALNGLPKLAVMRSSSISQFSDVVMEFKPGTDVLRARELVNEKLSVARPALPSWAAPPVISEPKSATSRIMMIGLTTKTLSAMDASVVAQNKVKARLLRVPGIANISIWGTKLLSRQVEIDPARLRASGLTLEQVKDATSNTLDNGSLLYEPSGKASTGGFVDTSNQRLQVQHGVPVVTKEELSSAVVAVRPDGTKLHIGDVANVVEETPPLIGDAVINGQPGLLMIIDKFPWGNTRDITKNIDAAVAELRPALPDMRIDPTIFRPASFIDDAVHNLTNSIVLGSLLVLFVLALFLFEWRSAVISIITIPVSLMASLLVLRARHVTVNTMILAGLVIALGAIVDDAIVDIENIVRRLRQHRSDGSNLSTGQIVLDASIEVRSAVVYASFIEIAALTPIFFLKSLTGSFFRPLAFAYALSVLVSLLVALLLTPALAMLMLRGAPLEKRGSPVARGLQHAYGRVLTGIVRRPLPAILGTIGIIAIGVVVLPRMGESLFPTFKERDFLIHFVSPPGTSIAEESRIVTQASHDYLAIPGVRDFGSHIGRAVGGEEVNDVNFGELWVSIDERVDYDKTLAAIQRVTDSYPGVYTDVQTYLRERSKETLTGAGNSIVVRIFGPDIQVLDAKGNEVDKLLGQIRGTSEHHVEFEQDVPQVEVRVDLDKAQKLGLKPGDVRRAASTLVAGEEVGAVFTNAKT